MIGLEVEQRTENGRTTVVEHVPIHRRDPLGRVFVIWRERIIETWTDADGHKVGRWTWGRVK